MHPGRLREFYNDVSSLIHFYFWWPRTVCHSRSLRGCSVKTSLFFFSIINRSKRETMTEGKSDLFINGRKEFATSGNAGAVRLWKKIQINEWTFSLFLFVASLSIVLGKLCINYGNILQLQNTAKYTIPSVSVFSNVPNTLGIRSIPASEKFVNISSRYEDVVANAVTSFVERCGWLIRAAISGLVMMGFTWFIIYKDSNIPGVNPPSPFSPSKRRLPASPRVQLNYLVGVLNGILIFLYMCL